MIFLDEFRMVILPQKLAITELIVFDTLIPEDCPGSLLRLGLPQRFHNRAAYIRADHDRSLGTLNGDEPLIADPAQAVLVLEIMSGRGPQALLIVRMQALAEQMRLTRTGSCVPWDEWSGDGVVVEIPTGDSDREVFVHGAQVVVVWGPHVGDWDVQTFDFSRRGRSCLPLLGGGGGIKSTRLGNHRDLICRPDGCIYPWLLKSLSDGSIFHLVSRLPSPLGTKSCADIVARG